MKFLLYSDVHLDYCFDHRNLPLDDSKLLCHLDELSIINKKAREFGCDHIVNLGDTFGSWRFLNRKRYKQNIRQVRKDFFFSSLLKNSPPKRRINLQKSFITRIDWILHKYNHLIREVFNGHIFISGNNDPFILPPELCNIFTYIDKPTVMLGKCLFMPMSWEEGGGLSYQAERKKNLSVQIANPDDIEIVFAHDYTDFNYFELSHFIQAKKLFHGHTHKRKIPKRPSSKNVCVGSFFLYDTGFITYDDMRNEIKTYNAQGEEVNHAPAPVV